MSSDVSARIEMSTGQSSCVEWFGAVGAARIPNWMTSRPRMCDRRCRIGVKWWHAVTEVIGLHADDSTLHRSARLYRVDVMHGCEEVSQGHAGLSPVEGPSVLPTGTASAQMVKER